MFEVATFIFSVIRQTLVGNTCKYQRSFYLLCSSIHNHSLAALYYNLYSLHEQIDSYLTALEQAGQFIDARGISTFIY
jgi:hypothetical protein